MPVGVALLLWEGTEGRNFSIEFFYIEFEKVLGKDSEVDALLSVEKGFDSKHKYEQTGPRGPD